MIAMPVENKIDTLLIADFKLFTKSIIIIILNL